jgi:hypothetical protein
VMSMFVCFYINWYEINLLKVQLVLFFDFI